MGEPKGPDGIEAHQVDKERAFEGKQLRENGPMRQRLHLKGENDHQERAGKREDIIAKRDHPRQARKLIVCYLHAVPPEGRGGILEAIYDGLVPPSRPLAHKGSLPYVL